MVFMLIGLFMHSCLQLLCIMGNWAFTFRTGWLIVFRWPGNSRHSLPYSIISQVACWSFWTPHRHLSVWRQFVANFFAVEMIVWNMDFWRSYLWHFHFHTRTLSPHFWFSSTTCLSWMFPPSCLTHSSFSRGQEIDPQSDDGRVSVFLLMALLH